MRRMYSEKQVKELARNEIENKDLDLKGDINLLEDKAIKSGDNSIIVNSQNDEIVLSGLVRADNDVEFEKDLSVDGDIVGANITGDSIIENMIGYSFEKSTDSFADEDLSILYAGACKNGNKLTLVIFGSFTKRSNIVSNPVIGSFTLPSSVLEKIIPYSTIYVDSKRVWCFNGVSNGVEKVFNCEKRNGKIFIGGRGFTADLTNDETYMFRYEATFLLSENLAE